MTETITEYRAAGLEEMNMLEWIWNWTAIMIIEEII